MLTCFNPFHEEVWDPQGVEKVASALQLVAVVLPASEAQHNTGDISRLARLGAPSNSDVAYRRLSERSCVWTVRVFGICTL